MKPKIKWSTGRTKDWEAREAQGEKDIRNGLWPGAWRPEDRVREPESQTDVPRESDGAASE